jgi:uncharacterized protein (UPF0335 family)
MVKAKNKLKKEIDDLTILLKHKAKHMSSDQLRSIRKRRARLNKSLKSYQQMLKEIYQQTGQLTLRI